MSDFENKDLEQTPQEPAEPSAPPAEPPYEKPTPHLTLEPDLPPEPPIYEQGPAPSPAADPFQMPPPPRAPEPQPYSEPSQAHSNYNNQYQQEQPQYQPPQYQYQPPQYQQPQYNTPPVGYVQKSRLAAGLLAFLLGTFGVHNFYLGFNTRGTVQLIVALAGGLLTCGVATVAVAVWAFIEAVMLLSAQPSRMYDANGVILRD